MGFEGKKDFLLIVNKRSGGRWSEDANEDPELVTLVGNVPIPLNQLSVLAYNPIR